MKMATVKEQACLPEQLGQMPNPELEIPFISIAEVPPADKAQRASQLISQRRAAFSRFVTALAVRAARDSVEGANVGDAS